MTDALDAPITLDQLEVFLAVVEAGSFSKAAKRLRRVQSAVSYSIANLERLLDVALFDRSGRTPVLTEAGRALLGDVMAVSDRVDRLHARARSLSTGLEPRVSLAVDVLFPMSSLIDSLCEFTERHPSVDLHLRTEALGAVTQLVLDGVCQLGIGVAMDDPPHGLTTRPLTTVEMVPVCAPDHALARLGHPAVAEDLREEVQIVVTDRSRLTEGQDRAVLSERTWRVADLETKRALLRAGFGWGMMPMHRVRDAIEDGALARVAIAEDAPRLVQLSSIHRTADPPGPAAAWLLSRLTV